MIRICNSVLSLILILLIVSCASTVPVPDTKYLPEQGEDVFPFFTSGQPIAAFQSDEAFLLLSLEPTLIVGRPYVRLWLLYENTSDQPYLFEPLKFATLTTTLISKDISGSSMPESPTTILAHISNEQAAKMIALAIGGALQQMAAKPTTAKTKVYKGPLEGVPVITATTTVNDVSEKRAAARDHTVDAMTNTARWYDLYQNSINQGILRRNTVFSGQSVHGFVYFPLPPEVKREYGRFSESKGYYRMDYYRSKDFMHIVALGIPTGTQNIKFMPIEGE